MMIQKEKWLQITRNDKIQPLEVAPFEDDAPEELDFKENDYFPLQLVH